MAQVFGTEMKRGLEPQHKQQRNPQFSGETEWQEGGNSKDRKGLWADSKDIVEITEVPRRTIKSCPNLRRMPTRSRRRICFRAVQITDEFEMLWFFLKRFVAWKATGRMDELQRSVRGP